MKIYFTELIESDCGQIIQFSNNAQTIERMITISSYTLYQIINDTRPLTMSI